MDPCNNDSRKGRQWRSGASYYRSALSGERLRGCYECASARVHQYLDAEIAYVRERTHGAQLVLELGCGYGRVLEHLLEKGRRTVGVDTSPESLGLATEMLAGKVGWALAAMDAAALGFQPGAFDVVVCVQNGVSAFRVPAGTLFDQALRVVRSGGVVMFSSYAHGFWPYRVEWFEAQAAAGLVGAIDYEATRPDEIVCKDGFRSGTFGAVHFDGVCDQLGVRGRITEVDGSSIFYEVTRD